MAEKFIKKYDIERPAQLVSMARVLKNHIVKEKLYTPIAGKNYVHIEGWQFAGGLMGIHPRVSEVKDLSRGQEIRWQATVELINSEGNVLSRGFAICSNKEARKKTFDEYAVLSMAQTRAIGKAYRNLIGWVMKVAGYASTPAEEMFRAGEVPPEPGMPSGAVKGPEGEPVYLCAIGDEPITKAERDYSTRLYGKPLCRAHQKEFKPKSHAR